MPAVSKKQQRFFALVHAYKNGKIKSRDISKSVRDAADSISDEDARHFAATKTKNLPEKKASPLDYMFVRGFLSRLEEQR